MKNEAIEKLNHLVETHRSVETSLDQLCVTRDQLEIELRKSEKTEDTERLQKLWEANELRRRKHYQRLNLIEQFIATHVLKHW